MLETIFWIMIGAFIGWNIPQPKWAQNVQENIKTYIKKIF